MSTELGSCKIEYDGKATRVWINGVEQKYLRGPIVFEQAGIGKLPTVTLTHMPLEDNEEKEQLWVCNSANKGKCPFKWSCSHGTPHYKSSNCNTKYNNVLCICVPHNRSEEEQ